MQTRIVIHKAYNTRGATNHLVEVGGRFFGFGDNTNADNNWRNRTVTRWLQIGYMASGETLAKIDLED